MIVTKIRKIFGTPEKRSFSIVMKFGGTSVGNADMIRNVAQIIKSQIKRRPVVVVSAVTKITDALIKLANECSQGKGDEILHNIKNVHFEILENLGINKNLLEENIEELSMLVSKTKSNKEIN